jgi:hypothetical protein
MKYSNTLFLLMALSLACFLAACSGVPTDSIKRTEQAKAEAVAEHADLFAQQSWSAAEKAMQEAKAKLDAKSYGEAGNLLLKARTNYVKARDVAKDRRQAAIKTITGYQTTINIRLKSDLRDNPGVSRLSPARKKEFDADVKQIEDNVAKVTDLLKNEKYAEAEYLAQKTQRDVFEKQQEYLKK